MNKYVITCKKEHIISGKYIASNTFFRIIQHFISCITGLSAFKSSIVTDNPEYDQKVFQYNLYPFLPLLVLLKNPLRKC